MRGRYKNIADLWVDIENIFIIIYMGLGAYGMTGVTYNGAPIASIFYVSCAIVLVVALTYLHKKAKKFCFGKRYSSAWGIVAAELYNKGACGNQYAPAIARITFIVVTIIPIITMTLMLYYNGLAMNLLNILVAFLALTVVEFVINWQFRKRFSIDYKKAPDAYK